MIIDAILTSAPFVYLSQVVDLPLREGEKVELNIISHLYAIGDLSILIKKNNKKRNLKTNTGIVDITDLCQTPGLIDIVISLLTGGTVVKSWRLESIVLKEVENSIQPLPELTAMREQLRTMAQAICELKELVIKSTEL